jgi:hypothetical protein
LLGTLEARGLGPSYLGGRFLQFKKNK